MALYFLQDYTTAAGWGWSSWIATKVSQSVDHVVFALAKVSKFKHAVQCTLRLEDNEFMCPDKYVDKHVRGKPII